VTLDADLLQQAREARDRLIDLQREADFAQVSYQHAIRRLHASGASLRAIADELGVSYQRVHQIVDLGTGKGAVKASRTDRECSFCGVLSDDARKLVAGPAVFICQSCVDLATEVLGEHAERMTERTRLIPVAEPRTKVRCSFCGKRRDRVDGLAESPDRPPAGKFGRRSGNPCICPDCLTLCGEILSRR
jgi:hypothetical protein